MIGKVLWKFRKTLLPASSEKFERNKFLGELVAL
jgi:hypothetical protein